MNKQLHYYKASVASHTASFWVLLGIENTIATKTQRLEGTQRIILLVYLSFLCAPFCLSGFVANLSFVASTSISTSVRRNQSRIELPLFTTSSITTMFT